jgi:hypothetical protein
MSTYLVRARAAAAGISWRSMQRASLSMNVERSKSGMNSGWTWSLPAVPPEGAKVLAPSVQSEVEPQPPGHTTCMAAYG